MSHEHGETLPADHECRKNSKGSCIWTGRIYRNICMDHVSDNMDVDYMVMIDLDLYSFDLDGVANTFGQATAWDCVSSNGRKVTPQNPFRLHFFDTFAFKAIGGDTPKSVQKIKHNQKAYRILTQGMPMFKVQSGFNGLAM